MRVVLDTNILVSALLISVGNPAAIYRGWQEGHFTLLVCAEQLDELRATLRKPAIAERVKPYTAGRLVNELKELAENIGALPRIRRSPDPTDDFLLALCEAGKADYLVTGDKSGLLALNRHKATRIIFCDRFCGIVDVTMVKEQKKAGCSAFAKGARSTPHTHQAVIDSLRNSRWFLRSSRIYNKSHCVS